MFSRIRTAIGLSFLLALITSITAFAKGSFSIITISGPSLKEEVRSTDPALTTDFFAFSVFYRDKTAVPANPGVGYEITRYYMDGREVAFDHLHYYPDTGFVYYDGLVNGSSEYDGKWYTAKPEIKPVFESALGITPVSKTWSIQLSGLIDWSQSILPIVIAAGWAVVLLIAFRLRRVRAR